MVVIRCPTHAAASVRHAYAGSPSSRMRELVAFLRAGAGLRAAYQVLEEDELAWELRRDARSHVGYRIHYVRARKGS